MARPRNIGVLQNIGRRICSSCGDEKDSQFFRSKTGFRCAQCERRERKARVTATPDGMAKWLNGNHDRWVRSRYGITHDQYEDLKKQQGGKCPICMQSLDGSTRAAHVDHDHRTGEIRGVLDHYCNLAVGHLFDDPARCLNAAAYLDPRYSADDRDHLS